MKQNANTLAHWHTGTLAHWHTGTLSALIREFTENEAKKENKSYTVSKLYHDCKAKYPEEFI